MWLSARLHAGLVLLTARRFRRILIASFVTLLTSALLLGLIGLTRWRGHQALQSDTRATITQAAQQFVRSLQSRRGTLTFIRDTLNHRSDLSLPQLQAMAASGVAHTRHLCGIGLAKAAQTPQWWSEPERLSAAELTELHQAIMARTNLRGVWRVPSTFIALLKHGPLLVMLEPFNTAPYRQSAIIGIFELRPLLEDFFRGSLLQRSPVQLLDGDQVLYRSEDWVLPNADHRPIILKSPLAIDAARWTLAMQPGSSGVTRTLSWLNVLLLALSIITGLGVTIIVWILAARTWILQRAVARRTAALRRASARLRHLAITDELTGLHNRRFFLNRWEWECDRAKRYGRPLACLMVDVNGFKQVNDRLGHPAGDLVLRQVAQELQVLLRQSDILARFGGDEFIIALPETSVSQAELVAEKLRQVHIRVPEGVDSGLASVSLSVGLGRIDAEHANPQDVLEAADQSLYAYKRRLKSLASPI